MREREDGEASVEFIHGSCHPEGRVLFRELAGCRSSNTLNLYPTMAIHVPAYFHAIMQRGRALGNITLYNHQPSTHGEREKK